MIELSVSVSYGCFEGLVLFIVEVNSHLDLLLCVHFVLLVVVHHLFLLAVRPLDFLV